MSNWNLHLWDSPVASPEAGYGVNLRSGFYRTTDSLLSQTTDYQLQQIYYQSPRAFLPVIPDWGKVPGVILHVHEHGTNKLKGFGIIRSVLHRDLALARHCAKNITSAMFWAERARA
jgi:hypothetical protein